MRRVTISLAALAIALAWTAVAGAQGGIEVRDSSARSEFPNGIVFTLNAASDAGFDEIRVVYQVAPDGVRTTAVPECSGGTVVSCTFELTASRRNVLVPGADVTYFWRLDSAGANEDTAARVIQYEDDRFDWKQLSDGTVTVFWYDGSEDEARAVLDAGSETLEEISALLQTTVEFPVKIRYYGSASDMQAAIISDNDEGVVTLGEVVYSDTAMVSADATPLDITRHEISHIVARQAVGSIFDVPDWLNEGLSVYAQAGPLRNQQQAVERAIESGDVLSVRSLSSASSGALSERVSLFYGQSWSLVSFLVDTYGGDELAELFRAFEQGSNDDDALEQVYGFDQDGLENAWRASVGLPPRTTPEPADVTDVDVVPTEAGDPADAVNGSDNGGDTPVVLIVAIALLTVLLAGGLAGAAFVLARRHS